MGFCAAQYFSEIFVAMDVVVDTFVGFEMAG
jgi:hypothetical protein